MTSEARELVAQPRDAAYELACWMYEYRLSGKELAKMLGCSTMAVSRWRSRYTKPKRWLAVKLEELTGGRVTAASWDETKGEP